MRYLTQLFSSSSRLDQPILPGCNKSHSNLRASLALTLQRFRCQRRHVPGLGLQMLGRQKRMRHCRVQCRGFPLSMRHLPPC